MKKFICILLAVAVAAVFAGCSAETNEDTTEPAETEEYTDAVTEKQTETTEVTTEATTAETTTAQPTTVAETTTKPDGSSIRGIIDTLESKQFYMAGTMNLTDGESMDAKATCQGDNTRIDITSAQMKMSMIYFEGVPYLANMSTNTYAVLDETAFDSMEQILSSMSAYGVSFSNSEISEMKGMMEDFDTTMDYSQYIKDGEYSEFNLTVDGEDYLVSEYLTDYGKIRIYTQDGELKIIDVFDTDGLRQMNFVVSAFIPQVLTPVSLSGLTKTTSIMNLFTVA